MNLKLFQIHGGIYRLTKYFKKDSGEMKPLGVQRKMRWYIFEGNREGLGP